MWIGQNEPDANRRRIYWWLVKSDATSVATSEAGNRPQWSLNGSAYTGATNTLSAISANAGRYSLDLTQSETSVAGIMVFRHSSATCFEQGNEGGQVQVFPTNPYNPQYLSQMSRLQGAASASAISLGSGETTLDGFFAGAGILVQFANGDMQFNIISTYTGATKSAVVQNAFGRTPASTTSYWILPGTQNVLNLASIATQVWSYSSTKTVDSVLTVYGFASGASLGILPGEYSGVSVAASVVSSILPSGRSQVVQSVLSYPVGNSRIVQQYLWPLRNKVASDQTASVATVYEPDDTTSSWTASLTTTGYPQSGFDPQG